MEELKIKTALESYKKQKPLRYHMPGHKAKSSFSKQFKIAGEDITELTFSDNLESPDGIIMEAEKRVAEILEVKKSWFLTDGSTVGVLSILHAVKDFGDKIIINRNAHKSVYNGAEMFNIEPIILSQNIADGLILPPNAYEIEKAFKENPTAIGVFLTYPDYYGLTFDIEKIKEITVKYNKLLLIDGAHGAHLKFSASAKYAGNYADIYVDGVHKTLPCLTQTAVLNCQNESLIESVNKSVNMLRTSSPNYILLSSIEYGEYFMAEKGKILLGALSEEVNLLKNRLSAKGVKTLNNGDTLKFIVDTKSVGVSPYKAEKYLNKHSAYIEMNDGRYLLFLLSPLTDARDLAKMEKFIYKIASSKKLKGSYEEKVALIASKRVAPYLSAIQGQKETIPLRGALNRVAAANVGVFPPCYPIITAGELITEEVIDALDKATFTFGVNGGKILVTLAEKS